MSIQQETRRSTPTIAFIATRESFASRATCMIRRRVESTTSGPNAPDEGYGANGNARRPRRHDLHWAPTGTSLTNSHGDRFASKSGRCGKAHNPAGDLQSVSSARLV